MTSTDLDAFEARVRTFFDAHAPRRTVLGPPRWGEGPDAVVAAGLAPGRDGPEDTVAARAFQRELFDAGLAWLTGPPADGGAGLGSAHVAAFRAVADAYDAPDTGCFIIGQHIVAPAIAAFGTPAQKRRWLTALFRGDVIGCQLFSEPDAGSDLASLRARAVRDGDGWRLNGQKVWSSGAHLAGLGEALVRTEDDPALRHRGLSMFLIDMASPGVTVRPLRQMNGNAHFNEVFLEDVFVPEDRLLGPRGAGWAVANASLSSERDISTEDLGLFRDPWGRLQQLATASDADADRVHRQRLADAHTRRLIGQQLPARLERADADVARVAPSLVKLHGASALWDIAQDAVAIVGPAATADTGAWGHYAWTGMLLGVHSQRIAGGTDEIQRNVIAERGLGLPRDPRPPTGGPQP
jgi:alkylation response protein AidB-like acyl-CoA dehydrogenase